MSEENTLTEEDRQARYSWYLERVRERREWYQKLSQDLDKLVFSVSSGTIILSITFIDKIITSQSIDHTAYLKIAWCLLIGCLVTNIATFFTSMQSTSRSKKNLDEWFESEQLTTPKPHNTLDLVTNILNGLSVILLLIGISFMTYFVSTNINALTNQPRSESEKTVAPFAHPIPPPNTTVTTPSPQTTSEAPNEQ